MIKIGEVLRDNNIQARKYLKKGKVFFIDSADRKYVLKEDCVDKNIYDYLRSRSFNYFPNVIYRKEEYEISEYQEDIEMPKEQKTLDMIKLVSLLHLKTTYYKDVDNDYYKKIYEDLLNNLEYLNSYYLDMISIIESRVYMSPSEYLLARNIGKIFNSLNYLDIKIKDWYKLVENKKNERVAVLHNNLELNHFIRNEGSYLISWNKSKIDNPIFDLYKFYLKNEDCNFRDILEVYENDYPLLEDERMLLIILIQIPKLIELDNNEFKNIVKVKRMFNALDKAFSLEQAFEATPNK